MASTFWPTYEWISADPGEHGFDPVLLNKTIEVIKNESIPISSLIVARNGYAVLEYGLATNNISLSIYSCTKGITSLLVGIAIDKGYIESVDNPISDYFNSSEWENPDPRKNSITIRHILTMSTGFDYDELSVPYGEAGNDFDSWHRSRDWVQFMLDLPMYIDPGIQFNFSTGASHLLSAILYQATDQKPLDFANQYLFGPIGVSSITWWDTDRQGIHNGGSGIRMTPRDMARIGHLILNNGTWNGTQVISENWVKNATSPQIHDFYGYQWWVLPEEKYGKGACNSAGFYDNLKITVLQEYDLVVVITSAYGEGIVAEWNRKLITDYIIPAIINVDGLNVSVGHPVLVLVVLSVIVRAKKSKLFGKANSRLK
jgi:CubicO group peptidase (beta-lactamase class C family)